MEVASGTATLKVRVEVSSKVKAEAEAGRCCDCAEGTETKVDAGCVSFRQAFGRTPLLAGMPVGALAIEEEVFDEALFTPAALRYDHPMMRRLDPETRLVTTPMGWTIAYGADGFPIDTDVALDSRLEEVASETQEVFADRSRVAYDAAGKVSALISPRGVRVPVDELGISVERDAAGNIARVESVADGTLEVAVTSPTAYTVSWTNAEGGRGEVLRVCERGGGHVAPDGRPLPGALAVGAGGARLRDDLGGGRRGGDDSADGGVCRRDGACGEADLARRDRRGGGDAAHRRQERQRGGGAFGGWAHDPLVHAGGGGRRLGTQGLGDGRAGIGARLCLRCLWAHADGNGNGRGTDAGDEPRLHGRPFGSAAVADDGGGGWDDGAHCLLHGGDGGGRRPH